MVLEQAIMYIERIEHVERLLSAAPKLQRAWDNGLRRSWELKHGLVAYSPRGERFVFSRNIDMGVFLHHLNITEPDAYINGVKVMMFAVEGMQYVDREFFDDPVNPTEDDLEVAFASMIYDAALEPVKQWLEKHSMSPTEILYVTEGPSD